MLGHDPLGHVILLIIGVGVDVQYLADDSSEPGVPFHRIKTSSASPKALLLLTSLRALGSSIADFTPNRPDLRNALTNALLDEQMLTHLVAQNALSAVRDLLPVLLTLMNALEVRLTFVRFTLLG